MARSKNRESIYLLSEIRILGCMSIDSPMDVNMKLLPDQGGLLKDVERYKKLAGKLNY